MDHNKWIYHITNMETLHSQSKDGYYHPPSLLSDGFIHCSSFDEILETARIWFKGQENLIVLEINPHKIPGKFCYEQAPGRESAMPHIYGALPLDAINRILSLTRGLEGSFFLQSDPQNLE